nr:reverse transcriptase domain-containing protein [Tanacetum cinerariifolium]
NPSPSLAFIKENIDVLRTMIKEHDQQAKMKATPRKLAYVDSDKEAPAETPSKNKEPTHLRRSRRLEDRSITKEKARRERSKPKGKRSEHQETSSDSEHEEGLEDAYEDLNSPYKRPKPTPFTHIITHFKYHKRAILPQNIRVYEGNKYPEDHLGGAAQNWFNDLDPKSVDSFEELSQKFLEKFLQQKIYAKDPIEIHGIKRKQKMMACKLLWIAKKLNDKIPKTIDKMFKRVRAFIRGEVATGSAEMACPYQGDKGTTSRVGIREGTVKIINMIMEGGNHKRPFEEGRSGLTDELTFSAIPCNQMTNEPIILEGIIEGNQVRRILVDGGSSLEIMYEHYFRDLNVNIRSRLRRCKASMIHTPRRANSALSYFQLGDEGLSSRGIKLNSTFITAEQAKIKAPPRKLSYADSDKEDPTRYLLGVAEQEEWTIPVWCKMFYQTLGGAVQNWFDDLDPKSVDSFEELSQKFLEEFSQQKRYAKDLTEIHGIKRRNQGRNGMNVINMIREEGNHKRPFEEGRIREQAILRARSNFGRGPSSGLASLEKTRSKEDVEEVFTISRERPDQEGRNSDTYFLYEPATTWNGDMLHLNKKRVQALIHTTRSFQTIFRKHKVKVVTDGPMEEILKLSEKEERLAKWAAEVRTYDILYIPRKEAEGIVIKKFFG